MKNRNMVGRKTSTTLAMTIAAIAIAASVGCAGAAENPKDPRTPVPLALAERERVDLGTERSKPTVDERGGPEETGPPGGATSGGSSTPKSEPMVTATAGPTEKPTRTLMVRSTPTAEATTTTSEPEEGSIVTRLSAQDRACLPAQATDDEALRSLGAQLETEQTRQILQCMSGEGRGEMLRLGMEETGELTTEQSECIAGGMAPMVAMEETPGTQAGILQAGAMMIGMIFVSAYCMHDTLSEDTNLTDEEREQLEYIRCAVDAAGGPEEYMSWLMNDPEAPDSLEERASHCGSPMG